MSKSPGSKGLCRVRATMATGVGLSEGDFHPRPAIRRSEPPRRLRERSADRPTEPVHVRGVPRAADMRSVPPTLELGAYGRFTVARKRVDRATAATFIQAAMAGLATLDGYELRAPNCPNCLISRRRYGFKSTAPFPPLSVFSRLFHHHSASFAELSRICSSPSFANLARSSKGVGYCEKSTRLPSNMSLS